MSVGNFEASPIVEVDEYMKWPQARELVNHAHGLRRATSVAHAWRYLIG